MRAFQTPIALSQKARDRSDEVEVVFIVIEINLFFSPWSFVDDGVEMFGICQLPEFHRDPPEHQPSDAVAERVTAVLYALAELDSIQDPYRVELYQSLVNF